MGIGDVPTRTGRTDSVIAIYQTLKTADFPNTLGFGSDNIWKSFWKAVGSSEYAQTKEFGDNASRRMYQERIVKDIAAIIILEPRAHWLQLFKEARVPSGPIYCIDEVASD